MQKEVKPKTTNIDNQKSSKDEIRIIVKIFQIVKYIKTNQFIREL